MSEIFMNSNSLMDYNFTIDRNENLHFHENIELLYVLEGQLKLKVEAETYEMNQDDLIIINMNQKHDYHVNEELLLGHIYLSAHALTELLNQDMILFWCNSVIDKSEAYADIRRIAKQIFNQSFEQTGQGKIFLSSLYYQLLHLLTNGFLVRSYDKRFVQIASKYDERTQKILAYIHASYKKQISLENLSKKLFLSKAYLSKYIKKQLGMTFIEYLNNIRLHHAITELLYTDHSMMRIALDNGFPNTASFNKVFKETYHMTPSAYQDEKKKKLSLKDNSEEQQLIKDKLESYFDRNPVQAADASERYEQYIIVDCNESEALNKNWNRMINIGQAKDLLRSDVQEHVLILKDKLLFSHIRFWNILSEDMYIDVNDKEGKYNFDMLDRCLDFLIKNHLKPYMDLGFKSFKLIRSSKDFAKTASLLSPEVLNEFDNPLVAFRFVTSLMIHMVNRYGLEEVEQWYFEVWKPEEEYPKNDKTINLKYYKIFDNIYSAIKQFSAKIKVGGAGLGIRFGQKNFKEMLLGWKEARCQPDFLTLYCYPYVPGEYQGLQLSKFSTDRSHMKNQLMMARRIMEDVDFKVNELHVTEWNSTIVNRNNFNDSCYKGAYIMKNLIDCIEYSDCIGYWSGSDILADYYDSRLILNGGCGLLTKDGIAKPALYAVEFLNKLGAQVIDKGDNYIITAHNGHKYTIACHNYKHFNYKYYLQPEDDIAIKGQNRLFDNFEEIHLKFQLKNVENGTYLVKNYSVNEKNGSVQDEWLHMNLTPNIGVEEIKYLRQVCTPRLSMKEYQVEHMTLNLETVLLPNEIQYIYISSI